MRIPSTSELVESQANKAYDKLAVISENLDKLEDIYEFIFNYYAFLKEKLSHYVPNDQDSIIKGIKEFHNEVKFLTDIEFSNLLVPEFKGTISCRYIDNDGKVPALVLSCGDNEIAQICLGWNTETNKPLLTVPDTVETMDNSAVTVAYLKNAINSIVNNNTSNLEQYVTKASMSTYLAPYALKTDLDALKALVNQKANQSDLDALRNQVNSTTTITNIKGLFWSKQQTYSHTTEGGDTIVMPEIGQKYPGSELYQNCTYDEATHTLVLSDPLNDGSYMCINPSRLYLGYTASGSVYNGNTTTADIYSESYERGTFAPVKIEG